MMLSEKKGVKAKKPHCCVLCGERINAGELYDRRTGVCDGDVWTMCMHPECQAYEQKPGVMDPDWYEDCSDPAFQRADAIAFAKETGA